MRKTPANSRLPKGGQSRPPLRIFEIFTQSSRVLGILRVLGFLGF